MSSVPLYKCSSVLWYKCSSVPLCKCLQFLCINVIQFLCMNVLQFLGINVFWVAHDEWITKLFLIIQKASSSNLYSRTVLNCFLFFQVTILCSVWLLFSLWLIDGLSVSSSHRSHKLLPKNVITSWWLIFFYLVDVHLLS